jgi:hypothetical protein
VPRSLGALEPGFLMISIAWPRRGANGPTLQKPGNSRRDMQKTLSTLPLSTSRGPPNLFTHLQISNARPVQTRSFHNTHQIIGPLRAAEAAPCTRLLRKSFVPVPIAHPTNAAFLSETRGGLQLRHGAPSNSALADERVRRAFPLVDCRVGPGI